MTISEIETEVLPSMFRGEGARGEPLRHVLITLTCGVLAGCSTLPSSGPTGGDIRHSASHASADQLPFQIVDVTTAAALPSAATIPQSTLVAAVPQPTDLVGPGDVLNISIYEVGVTLFGRAATKLASTPTGTADVDEGASSEQVGGVRVDDQGFIRVPFVGKLRAAGHTTAELQSMIRSGLVGKSQDPQVQVSLEQSITNSVVLAGEVNKPGRFVLSTNRESLNDTIALSGGYRGEAKDVVARVEREGRSFEIRMSDLMDLPTRDFRIAPGDRITLISRPQSFSALGAPNRAEQIRFPTGSVSLAEAIALAGGVNPNQGDASAIFVFRYVPGASGTAEPVVYHLDMMKPGALLLSQRFMMNDKDLLYVGNSAANQPSKFIQLVSQLFLPVATVSNVVNTTRN